MLCSKCHREIKPIVAVDVDGTLGDYHSHFISFACAYFDWAIGAHINFDGSRSFRDWFCEVFDIDVKRWHDVKLAYRQGGMKRTMPIFDGARALCWAVRDAGAELWITTTRPYLSLDNIVPDTVEWLRRHEIEYDGMLFDEDKYTQLANRVDSRRVVAVLDDLPEMYDAAAHVLEFGWDVPILVTGLYNRGVRRTMMADLDASIDIVLARIEHWNNYWAKEFNFHG